MSNYVILFHTDRHPPLLVPGDTMAVAGYDMPDTAHRLPSLTNSDALAFANVYGVSVLRYRTTVDGVFHEHGDFAHVLAEEPTGGVWHRYRAVPLGHRGSVLLALASLWTPYDRLSVDPSLDLGAIGQRTLLTPDALMAAITALEARGMVFEAPERHGIRRWAYVPEAPAKCLPWIETVMAPYAEDMELNDRMRSALRGALTAYCGVMGRSYDPHRTVCRMKIDQIAAQVYARMVGGTYFPVVVGAALAMLKRRLAADLPGAAYITPAGEVT